MNIWQCSSGRALFAVPLVHCNLLFIGLALPLRGETTEWFSFHLRPHILGMFARCYYKLWVGLLASYSLKVACHASHNNKSSKVRESRWVWEQAKKKCPFWAPTQRAVALVFDTFCKMKKDPEACHWEWRDKSLNNMGLRKEKSQIDVKQAPYRNWKFLAITNPSWDCQI